MAMPSQNLSNMFQDGFEGSGANRFIRQHRKKVSAHAIKSLHGSPNFAELEEVAKPFRKFLKIEDWRLRIAHRLGARGAWTAAARSSIVDLFITHVFETVIERRPEPGVDGLRECAVIALGGYGRRELAPFSDIDLLFLHTTRLSPVEIKERIERLLHLLWDAGLNVGHRYHTIEECLAASGADPHFATALVSARIVAGDRTLFDRLLTEVERKRRKRAAGFVAAVLREGASRREKRGASLYLQEPNIKESIGGLRDLHMALWISYARFNCRTLEELLAGHHINDTEYVSAVEAYDFLLRVRHEAHWLAKRKTDQITLDLQPPLAELFGYTATSHLRASEQFMRDYYRRVRDLHLFSEVILARAAAKEDRQMGWLRKTGLLREQSAEPFSIRAKELRLETGANAFPETPALFFQAFALAQKAGVQLSHDLREAIRNSLGEIDRSFRTSAGSAGAFLSLLRQRGRVGYVLRMMHEVGFLSRYLPEINRISLLIQHDLYHHYTIDEHTLQAIEALDHLHHSQDKPRVHLRAALDQVEDVGLVYLAVLLHDLGKGRGGGHVLRGAHIAERVCARLHLDAESAGKVALLVKHHVSMAHISQRRDLNETHVVAQFAAQIGSLDMLNMLLLLTYADMSGVGPGVWTDWKGALLRQLYVRTREHLANGEAAPPSNSYLAQLKKGIAIALAGQFAPGVVECHLQQLPDRYARMASAKIVAAHLYLIEQLHQDTLACRWNSHEIMASELLIAARGRRGLFADIAGALASQGVEILSADLQTRADGVAIDTLVLREAATHGVIDGRRWQAIERAIKAAVKDEQDVAALVEQWRKRNAPRRQKVFDARPRIAPSVRCDNGAAEAATLVEVHAADEPGLAYKISSTLAECGLDIVYAKIATEKSDALDVFYVTTERGTKVSDSELSVVQRKLIDALWTSNTATILQAK